MSCIGHTRQGNASQTADTAQTGGRSPPWSSPLHSSVSGKRKTHNDSQTIPPATQSRPLGTGTAHFLHPSPPTLAHMHAYAHEPTHRLTLIHTPHMCTLYSSSLYAMIDIDCVHERGEMVLGVSSLPGSLCSPCQLHCMLSVPY